MIQDKRQQMYDATDKTRLGSYESGMSLFVLNNKSSLNIELCVTFNCVM